MSEACLTIESALIINLEYPRTSSISTTTITHSSVISTTEKKNNQGPATVTTTSRIQLLKRNRSKMKDKEFLYVHSFRCLFSF